MIDVTQLYCPMSGGQPDGDNTTHHLVPKGVAVRQLVCRYCGKPEKQLREEAEKNEAGAEKWVPEAIAEQEAYLARRRAERDQ